MTHRTTLCGDLKQRFGGSRWAEEYVAQITEEILREPTEPVRIDLAPEYDPLMTLVWELLDKEHDKQRMDYALGQIAEE